jgi:hypothetical protein
MITVFSECRTTEMQLSESDYTSALFRILTFIYDDAKFLKSMIVIGKQTGKPSFNLQHLQAFCEGPMCLILEGKSWSADFC